MSEEQKEAPEAAEESQVEPESETALAESMDGNGELEGDQPPDIIPLLPVRDTVLFPHAVMPLNVGRPSSVALVRSLGENKHLAVVAQRDHTVDQPGPDDFYKIGVLAMLHKVVRMPNNSLLVFCEGVSRIALGEIVEREPFYKIKYQNFVEQEAPETSEIVALQQSALAMFHDIVELSPALSEEAWQMAENIKGAGRIADFIASTVPGVSSDEKQKALEVIDIRERLEALLHILSKEREVLQLRHKITTQVQDQLSQTQREFYLREQMKAIQKELGDSDDQAEVEELRQKIDESGMPDEVKKDAHRELKRLARMSPAAADYTVARTYLDWLVVLPWDKSTGSKVDVVKAKQVLDEDHYDLEKIKERILDYMAVLQLKPTLKGPILCLVGPPGVGKTSLGKSIARAIGREFVRISLGGVHDEAEIRGHRRTYIGALPGQIIQGIRRAGVNDPVFMLDEIDKLGRDFRGDPASALLEVLDPAQNNTFRDHYLDAPFDLSKVLFVTTANVLDPIPGALRDRMEVLELQGYTEAEKARIAVDYLVPRQVEENGLSAKDIEFQEAAIHHVVRRYTREAGVRNLEREIGTICRKQARRLAELRSANETVETGALEITPAVVEEMLGSPKVRDEVEIAERTQRAGVAVGLAWTPSGGEILFIEATSMPGAGKGIILTGQLGKVMQESMQAALSWVRSHTKEVGIPSKALRDTDLHVHVPAGAIPKDGPSAGITVVTTLVSLLTDRRVKPWVAMTGEITLSGLVLPIGGVKEKVLAARRARIKEVILPKENEVNVKEDLKAEQLGDLIIHYVETVEEVIELALMKIDKKRKK